MQNDSNVEMKQTEISNPEYVLTIETHEGLMLTHPLSMEEAKVIGKMALSGTARKDLLKNFFHSVKDKYAEFSHIKKWLESILASTKTEFFTVQMEKIDPPQAEIPAYLQCEPRIYTLKSKNDFNEIFEATIEIKIKCTDNHISEVFQSWFGSDSTSISQQLLKNSKGDKLLFILKLIAWQTTTYCIENDVVIDWADLNKWLLNNEILKGFQDCFEISTIDFDIFLGHEHFEIVEGVNN
ncbi:hypothetical protein [Acinetobacter seifertii]|uniref:Uncharacterized protein n=1 Tax=Acinetobacter seifertii TaxID=1530123 RepID=A0A7H2V904_9GAMM|nr:hypothetical protein [Acinetobacter seifertii]QNX72837.1 hypothetical protein IC776_02750 [Acinetobacter seifertii]